MKYSLTGIILSFFLVFLAFGAQAQSGRIVGTVIDAADGEPLVGVNVIIQGTTQGGTTNLDGLYRILNVRPGTYSLEFRYLGYQPQIITDVLVRSDLTTEINIELSSDFIEGEEIIVRATRDVVLRDLTSSESRVTREDLERMPVQELTDVVRLQSGVTVGAGGSIHIRGGRSTEIAYIVDGVRVSDDYDRSSGLRIENQAIEEIQVVSGTFNAEYGQATSGIINISTRSGTNDFRGNFRFWSGEYGTARNQLYENSPQQIGDVNPFHMYNMEGSLSGPIIKDRLTFFGSARVFSNDGWLYGYNAFSPQGPIGPGFDQETQQQTWERGLSELPADNPVNRYGHVIDPSLPWYDIVETIEMDGQEFIRYRDSGFRDSTLVAMNPFRTLSFQGNLQFNASSLFRFNLIGNYGTERGKGYNHSQRLVAKSIPEFERQNYYVNLRTTITPSARTFMTTNFAVRRNMVNNSLFDSPFDRRFYNYERNQDLPPDFQFGRVGRFNRLGTYNSFFERSTTTFITKAEISSQLDDRHLVKAGVELQADIMDFQAFSLVPLATGGRVILPDDLPEDKLSGPTALELGVPEKNTPAHEIWTRKPMLLSAFIQDRIEYENLIINAGIRFDYFQPNGRVPASDRPALTSDYESRGDDFWKPVSAKFQLSPRLGIAYPISERGVLHFSYGYFFQVPDYNKLYNQDKLILQSISGVQGIFGNPDLKPEQSVKYELGLQQEVFAGTALDLTIFYEDKRDYVSSGPIKETNIPSVRYGTWINRDYANIRGITASLNQRVSRAVSFGFDYTFSIAEDSNSDPSAEFFAAVARSDTSGTNLARFLTPANWDRTHVFNSTFFYAGSDWGFNVIQRFSSGLPYTPSTDIPRRVGISASGEILQNSIRMPSHFSIDLNVFKTISLLDNDLRLFFNIYNLLDNENVNFVYNDSGSTQLPLNPPAEFDNGFYNNPSHYSEPRRIQFGAQISF